MKFGKEFAAQMVPEWQEAYMNYSYLKTVLKEIIRFKQRTKSSLSTQSSLKRSFTLYRAFSGLTHRHRHGPETPESPLDIESQAILVNQADDDGSENYKTTFLMAAETGGEYELVYFRRLDEELNKVDRFYRSKVQEVMHEAEMLNKQMDALIAFRIKVDNPQGHWIDRSMEMTRIASDIAASTAALSASTPAGAKSSSRKNAHMDIIEEGSGPESADNEKEEGEINPVKKEVMLERSPQVHTMRSANIKRMRPAPLEVLNKVTMNKNIETPRSTIKGVLQVPINTELKFTKENLKKVEEKLKRAFIEFYQKLRLLRSYSFLNALAFSKIMKKYDKITGRTASKSYMEMVDNSNFGCSDEVMKLMERVETTFIKHFANSNRRKGMNILRPKAKKERHIITFSTGFFAGCTISLLLALVLLIRQHSLLEKDGRGKYMETLFPLYSLFGFIVLHVLMYAANIYFWRRYRVNYSFIFGFKQGTEKGYREVFLVGFVISGLALASVIGNLDMETDPRTHDYKAITELLPLMLVLILGAILFCPFNIIYRSSRFFLLTCLFHCLCAPLYKVTLPDFFLGDQLTSQVQTFRSMEFYVCYYGWGDYKHRENSCSTNDAYNTFYFIVAVVPYASRLLQCLRRYFEERDTMQGVNGIKYFLTIVSICLRTAFSLNKGEGYRILSWVFSIIAAILSTYWDIVFDWGLLQRKSRNRWLRDKLLISRKSVYYVAVVLNVFLRFAWLQSVLEFKMSLHRQTMITIVASLEIIRRGIWNFFRLENEHLNNVGKFRAFKSVPLPFNYDEDDDKDD